VRYNAIELEFHVVLPSRRIAGPGEQNAQNQGNALY
jgi:hypothetical protein